MAKNKKTPTTTTVIHTFHRLTEEEIRYLLEEQAKNAETAEDQAPTPAEEQAPTPAEEQAPTPAEEQALTPTEENQALNGGEELDRAAEALNWLRMGQIVGIIVMGAESNDDNAEDEPTEDQTSESTATEDPTPAHAEETAPAEESALEPTAEVTIAEPDSAHRELPSQQQPYPEYKHPMRGTFASREDIERLNDLLGSLTDPNNEPDQTRGRARDICHLALELGADRLVDVCEDFTEGDATRADVAATASEVLTYLAAETRRAEFNEAFEQFCVKQHTTPEEMLAILS